MENKLYLLLELSESLVKERDLKTILIKMMDTTKLILNCDRCSIFLHDDLTAELWTIVAHGVNEIRVPNKKGIVGNVYQSGETINITDAYNDPRFNSSVDKDTGYRTRTILTIPLIDKNDKAIGVFEVINKQDNETFTEDDVHLLKHIAVYAASTIENAMLYKKLRGAHEDVIYRLSHATKFKDPETRNHIIRVGKYCAILARQLGWAQEEVDTICLAAPMHDIGKVGIPDRILLKPGKLDNEEWAIMKKHTIFGYEILKGGESQLLRCAQKLALDHHEKWNGTGYPHGKVGADIAIEGRMTAISDVFDALSSRRPYKDPWPLEKVTAFLREESGKHFDPNLIGIFLRRLNDMVAVQRELKDVLEE
ncbi:MAG: GAF domain-containing protein [Chitinivibrionales bacterium]|nr:GAF domain-containing protein [Chitinivibrionales bacterium]